MFQNLHRTMRAGDTLKLECTVRPHNVAWGNSEAMRRCGPDATPMDNVRLHPQQFLEAELGPFGP